MPDFSNKSNFRRGYVSGNTNDSKMDHNDIRDLDSQSLSYDRGSYGSRRLLVQPENASLSEKHDRSRSAWRSYNSDRPYPSERSYDSDRAHPSGRSFDFDESFSSGRGFSSDRSHSSGRFSDSESSFSSDRSFNSNRSIPSGRTFSSDRSHSSGRFSDSESSFSSDGSFDSNRSISGRSFTSDRSYSYGRPLSSKVSYSSDRDDSYFLDSEESHYESQSDMSWENEPQGIGKRMISFFLGFLLPFVLINGLLLLFTVSAPVVELSDPETNDYITAYVKLTVDSLIPVKSVNMTLGGEEIDLVKKDGAYYAALTENGALSVTCVSLNNMTKTVFSQVSLLDEDAPVIDSDNVNMGAGYLEFDISDDLSGVDYTSIYGIDQNNSQVFPTEIISDTGKITFSMTTPTLIVYAKDLAGNDVSFNFSLDQT